MNFPTTIAIMKKYFIATTKFTGGFIFLFFLYILWVAGYGTFTDYQPVDKIPLTAHKKAATKIIEDSTLSFITWNMGYGGLGAESNFFYDDGGFFSSGNKMIRTPAEYVNKNIKGATDFLASNKADFYLLQEVDVESKRSYYRNQLSEYEQQLSQYASFFAPNYVVDRVPIPIFEPWQVYGKVYSGLGTLSRFRAKIATRLQLPGKFEWPTRIFQLDRCLAFHRFEINNGKELVVINLHNSAYDSGGFLKKQQMDFLKEKVISEYEKGHYVIVGGDWNQCPPDFKFDQFMPNRAEGYFQSNIKKDFLPAGWKWGYDPQTPTNRKTANPYKKGTTFETLIDFFLVSPNVQILSVEGVSQDFNFSDHQPVKMVVQLVD